jgi:hypothetical protein
MVLELRSSTATILTMKLSNPKMERVDPNALVRLGEILSLLDRDCFLDKRNSARFCGVGLRTFESWMDRIPRYRPSGKVLFRKSELIQFMERHQEQPVDVDLERLADDAVAAVMR